MRRYTILLLRSVILVLILGTVAAPARADWFLTPYAGIAFGGVSNQFVLNDLDDEFEQRVNFGASFGYRTKGIFGFEVDYDVAPNFFQFTGGGGNFDLLDMDSSVRTMTSFSATCSARRPPIACTDLAPFISTPMAMDERNLTSER